MYVVLIAAVVLAGGWLLLMSTPKDVNAHIIGPRGWVEADPHDLAVAAGVTENVYALASMMESEAGGNVTAQIACGWAIRNAADSRGESVFKLLTRAGRNEPGTHNLIRHESYGHYGPQNVGPRKASTRKPPTAQSIDLAERVLNGDVDDPTGGATGFDAPTAQDTFLDKIKGYTKTAAQIAEERSKGADMVMIPGVETIRFWVPRSKEG